MAIRYDKKFNAEINRVVRNFNNKVNRLNRLDKQLELPERVSVKDLKASFNKRTDLKRALKDLELFNTRGMEKAITTEGGATLSRYNLELIKRQTRRTKSEITRELRRRETTKIKTFGEKESVTYAEIGERSYLNLKARRKALNKNIMKLNKAELKGFASLLEKSKNKREYDFNQLQYNWANEMLIPVAYMSGYDMDKLEIVNKKIASLGEKEFLNLFNDEEVMKVITEYYAELRDGEASEKEIALIHENLDMLVSNIDKILEDYV